MFTLRPLAALLVAVAVLGGVGTPSAGQGQPKKPEPGPRQIDLSPLPTLPFPERYSFSIKCQAGRHTYSMGFNIGNRTGPDMVRDLVMASMETAGWKVKAVGDDKLIVYGYDHDPVNSLTITADKLPKKSHPKVSRVKGP
jgi:hypothetical protein